MKNKYLQEPNDNKDLWDVYVVWVTKSVIILSSLSIISLLLLFLFY